MASFETTMILVVVIIILVEIFRRAIDHLQALTPQLALLQNQIAQLQKVQTESETAEVQLKNTISDLEYRLDQFQNAQSEILSLTRASDDEIEELRNQIGDLEKAQVRAAMQIENMAAEMEVLKTQIECTRVTDQEEKLTLIRSIGARVSKVEATDLEKDYDMRTVASRLAHVGLESKRKSMRSRMSISRMSNVHSAIERSVRGTDINGRFSGTFEGIDMEREKRKSALGEQVDPAIRRNARKDSGNDGEGDLYDKGSPDVNESATGFILDDERSGSAVGVREGREGRRFGKIPGRTFF